MKNRLNFGLFLVFLVLINFKVILLNEETLILLCFIIFCLLVVSRLSHAISSFFSTQIDSIKSALLTSAWQVIKTTKTEKVLVTNSLPWPKVFSSLKTELTHFNTFLFSNFGNSYYMGLQNQLNKKLEFSKRFEIQISKLIITIILEKIQKISKLHSFCSTILVVPTVLTMNKVYFREHLQKIIH